MITTPQLNALIDTTPHLWFTSSPSIQNVGHDQIVGTSSNTSGAHNLITVSLMATSGTGGTRYSESKIQNSTTTTSPNFQNGLESVEQTHAKSLKNLQGPPPPQPQSSNNHESLLQTFQHWKPSQTDVPPQSPQNSMEQTYNSETTVNGSNSPVSPVQLISNHSYSTAAQQQIHHQPLNQRQTTEHPTVHGPFLVMSASPPTIPHDFTFHVMDELFKHLGVSTDFKQIEHLIEDIGDDSDLLTQFLGCAYDHIYEPEAVIIQEEQHITKSNHFTLSFRVHLKLLRLRALVVFLCFKLCKNNPDQQCGLWLVEKMSDGLLLLDVEALSDISCSGFFEQMQVIEQTLRFEAEVAQPSRHLQVTNNTMNNIRLKSNENDKLIASFEDVAIFFLKKADDDAKMHTSSEEEPNNIIREYDVENSHRQSRAIYSGQEESVKLCLLIHIGKYMTFVKNGQKNFVVHMDNSTPSPLNRRTWKQYVDDESQHLAISEILPRNGSYYSNGVVQMSWNKEFFVTPKRENTDIYFMVKFGDKRIATVEALFIDHMRVLVPCEDVENCGKSNSDDDSSNSGDSPISESVTVPVSVLHNNRELTREPLHYTFWIPNHSTANSISPPSTPSSSLCGKRSYDEQNLFATMDEDDMELINNMNGATLASPVETPMRKRPRLDSLDDKAKSTLLHRIRDPCGFTLLHSAAFRGYTKLVNLLIDKQNFPVDQRDHYHFTPLHWACYCGHIDLAMFLMKRGASPTQQNMFALTAPDIAEEQNHMELWHAMESELQRQACCALFTLFSAKADDDKTINKKTKSQSPPQRRQSASSPPTNISNANTTATSTTINSNYSTCQPATLIKKTPKGVESRNQTMELFIKPSRKKRTYISFFPNELCSSPYKYDILLRIPLHFTNQFNELQFTFHLMIQGTDQTWQRVNQVDAVEVVKYLRTMFPLNYREIEWRIMFRVCSFHFHRKPFKFQVVYNSKLQQQVPASAREEQHIMESALGEGHDQQQSQTVGNGDIMETKTTLVDDSVVFESEPFYIVARKKKKSGDFFDL
jgi:hypothetical protein